MVKRVERVSTNLQGHGFPKTHELPGADIPIVDSGPGNDIRSSVAEVVWLGLRKARGIEPIVTVAPDILVFQAGSAVAKLIGTVIGHWVHRGAACGQYGKRKPL